MQILNAYLIDGYKNNPKNSSTTKVGEYIPSSFSMSTILSFRSTENRHNVYEVKIAWEKVVDP